MPENGKLNSTLETNHANEGQSGFSIVETGGHEMFVIRNTEERLWDNLKKGNQNALGDLYKLYIDELFAYGLSIIHDREHVMDCIHDLFVDLYKYRRGLSKTDNVKYYLLKSLKRKINNKHYRKATPATRIYVPQYPKDQKNFTKSHEEELINKERLSEKSKKLDRALDSLTKKQRRGLLLKFREQRTYKEISEMMGISKESARTIIYRALKRFR